MGKIDHLARFNSSTQGIKSRNCIKKTQQNKIILFLPRTWNSLPNRIGINVCNVICVAFGPYISEFSPSTFCPRQHRHSWLLSFFDLIIYCNNFLKRKQPQTTKPNVMAQISEQSPKVKGSDYTNPISLPFSSPLHSQISEGFTPFFFCSHWDHPLSMNSVAFSARGRSGSK